MTRPLRVLLVDDDAMIRRFVALALEDEAVTLIGCADGQAALAELRRQPVDLLITDLMMPGMDGFQLLEALQAEPGLLHGARRVVFSAGLQPEREARLRALGVADFLAKPVSVAALVALVRAQHATAKETASPPPPPSPAPSPASPHQATIERQFGGDAALYQAFRNACLVQYAHDRAEASAALARGDAAALRRLAHNFKGSLRTLGETEAADAALQLEQAAHDGADAARWPALWARLDLVLRRLA